MEGVPGINREEILNEIKHTKCEDEGTVYIKNRLRRSTTKGMMFCLIALMLYRIWAGDPYYDLMAVFWLYGGIVMFSGYRISKMKSYFVIALLEFAVAAVSVEVYIKTTWPLD